MSQADFAFPDSVAADADIYGPCYRVNLDRRMRRLRDRDVSRRAEEGLDLDSRAAHLNPVENSSRPRDSDGREYAQNAERDGELENGKGMPHDPSAALAG